MRRPDGLRVEDSSGHVLVAQLSTSDDREAAGGPTLRDRNPDLRYADAHRVRLDVQTGVCVYTEELGGSSAGSGHDMRIEAVDEPTTDELFSR